MTTTFSIDRATLDDCDRLAKIGAETFVETFGHLYNPRDLSAFLETSHSAEAYRKALRGESEAWLATSRDGHTVGFAVIGPCGMPVDPMPPRAGELSRLYLLRTAQGAGLGSELLNVALDRMEQQYSEHYLSVFSENLGAQRLYHRYGFEKVGEYKYMVGSHADHEFVYHRTRRIRPIG
ncbi:MAG: GNAT family N-acetyltransferase [Parvularculaceae bacterium]|nr:GNAT family N-acetyltransferase [Parvularculaceae bacterium]